MSVTADGKALIYIQLLRKVKRFFEILFLGRDYAIVDVPSRDLPGKQKTKNGVCHSVFQFLNRKSQENANGN